MPSVLEIVLKDPALRGQVHSTPFYDCCGAKVLSHFYIRTYPPRVDPINVAESHKERMIRLVKKLTAKACDDYCDTGLFIYITADQPSIEAGLEAAGWVLCKTTAENPNTTQTLSTWLYVTGNPPIEEACDCGDEDCQ